MVDVIVKKSKIEGNGVFADRDFKKGEEITGNYFEDEIPGFEMKCNCKSKNCCGIIKK